MSSDELIGATPGIGLEHPLTQLNRNMQTLLKAVGAARAGVVRSFVNVPERARVDYHYSETHGPVMEVTYRGITYEPTGPESEVQQIQAALIALGAYWRPELETVFKEAMRPSSPDYPLPHPIDWGAPIGMQKAGIYLLLVKRLVRELDVAMLLPHPEQPVDDLLDLANKEEQAKAAAQLALSQKVLETKVEDPDAPDCPLDRFSPWWAEQH